MRGRDGAHHLITGVYRELQPDFRIAKTWIYNGPFGALCAMETLLEVDLREIEVKATELTLTHSHIANADAQKGYQGDWPSCMDKLQNLFGKSPS